MRKQLSIPSLTLLIVLAGIGFFLLITYTDKIPHLDLQSQTAAVSDFNSSLVAHYTFDEGSGTTANDSAGSNDGTLTGGPTWTSGKMGSGALSFDGVDDYVTSGSINSSSLSALSYSFWVKPTDTAVDSILISWSNYRYCKFEDNRTIECSVDGGAPSTNYVLNEGQWYHIAFTSVGTSQVLYVNGVAVSNQTETLKTDPGTIKIGSNASGVTNFKGDIDDVRVYTRGLTSEEVVALYQGIPEDETNNESTDPVTNEDNTVVDTEDPPESENVDNGVCSQTHIRCVPIEYSTLQACLTSAQPGDTCLLAPGVYSSSATTVRNGTADSMIIIKGAGPDETIIDTGRLTLSHKYHKLTGVRIQGNYLRMTSGADHNLIEGNKFTAGTQGIYMNDSGTNDGSTGPSFNTITKNTFYMPTGNGMVVLLGRNNTVSFNAFRDGNGYDALRVWGLNHVISDNTFDRIISGSSANPPHTNHGDIIQTFNSSNSYIAQGIIFERNYIKDGNAQFGNFENDPTNTRIQDWTFRNNVFVRSRLQLNITVPKVKFYNNIAYAVPAVHTNGIRFSYHATRGSADYGEVYNNIFIGDGGYYSFHTSTIGSVADNNIVANLDGSPKKVLYQEVHGINGGVRAEDIFLDHMNDDFRLKPGSIAIDRGIDLRQKGFFDDLLGTPRPQGSNWDIGAYEYYSGQPTAPTIPTIPTTPVIPEVVDTPIIPVVPTPPVVTPAVPPVIPANTPVTAPANTQPSSPATQPPILSRNASSQFSQQSSQQSPYRRITDADIADPELTTIETTQPQTFFEKIILKLRTVWQRILRGTERIGEVLAGHSIQILT